MIIEINLLPGPKKKRGAARGISVPSFSELVSKVRDPLLLGAGAALVGSVATTAFLYTSQQAQISRLEEQATRVRAESRRFTNLLAQKRRVENLRDSLLQELQAIRQIDADRYVWAHVLEEVTKALPDYTWLAGLTVLPDAPQVGELADSDVPPPMRFSLDGRTSDIGAYTRFLRQLSTSPWVGRVREGATRTVIEQDKALTAFSITVTFKQADSAFVRTVPLHTSVR